VLPPNTNAEKFEEYVRRAADIVGQGNVTIISDRSELTKYSYLDPSKCSDMFWIMEKDYFLCSAVVAPTRVPDVQALMKLANEFDIPVWPFSIGRNLGYGAAAPRVRGSVGLDMGRNMKKILKVDVDGAYAVVEPGVIYFDLAKYLVCISNCAPGDVGDCFVRVGRQQSSRQSVA
jgi:FAD/FMN-containing dehydrogenase